MQDGTIGEDENSIDITKLILNFSCNTLFVEFILRNTPSISQSRCVKDVNLCKRSCMLIIFTGFVAY